MIDTEGYRPNVGIILCNQDNELFWARRIGEDAWQFPQGGIRMNESPEEALYRELGEEIGLTENDVELIGVTRNWLRYHLPRGLIRRDQKPVCIGQKQRWFLLRLLSCESQVCLDNGHKPEFDEWCWVDHEHPVHNVVTFKRDVYREALSELIPLLGEQSGTVQKRSGRK